MIAFRHAGIEDLSVIADLLSEVETFYGTVEVAPHQVWEEQIALVPSSPRPGRRSTRRAPTRAP
jgi:hypothetical protein